MAEVKNKVRGLAHFVDHFATERDQYVIIGGIAAMFSLEDSGIEARATKDIDLVIAAHPSISFADKIKQYVRDGQYQIQKGQDSDSRNYRFTRPGNEDYPVQIEIFSFAELAFDLRPVQEIIPIETSQGLGSLSAILMDEAYFNLVKQDIRVVDGVPVLQHSSLIPLKARAFLDLTERKADGENIDSRDIKKHRNDVLKLLATIPNNTFALDNSIAEDLRGFLNHNQIRDIDQAALRSVIGIRTSIDELRKIAVGYFQL
jgi:hypothetical protein